MQKQIPGTVLTGTPEDLQHIEEKLDSMFLGGGITRAQVVTLSGLEPYMVQNWVKRGFLPPPQAKRYSKTQLCRILNINALRSTLPMERICGLLTYINGQLDDESDDLIDDADLYAMFVHLVGSVDLHDTGSDWASRIEIQLRSYQEIVPGAKERIAKVLMVMLVAWTSATLRANAEKLLSNL